MREGEGLSSFPLTRQAVPPGLGQMLTKPGPMKGDQSHPYGTQRPCGPATWPPDPNNPPCPDPRTEGGWQTRPGGRRLRPALPASVSTSSGQRSDCPHPSGSLGGKARPVRPGPGASHLYSLISGPGLCVPPSAPISQEARRPGYGWTQRALDSNSAPAPPRPAV